MALLLLLLAFLATTASLEHCQTPDQQPGKCVVINHCPHLLAALRQEDATNSSKVKEHARRSHCGFEYRFLPKMCCPIEAIEMFDQTHNRHATKCGLHPPQGPADPWLALLEYSEPRGTPAILCGGVLINKRYVLTAAHCIKGGSIPQNANLVNVYLGDYSSGIPDSMMHIPVQDSIVHQNYLADDPHHHDDIALVRLQKKVSFKEDFVRPICLPTSDGSKLAGKVLSVAGWSNSTDDFRKLAGIAQVWRSSRCRLVDNGITVQVRDSQMCAGSKKELHGDSHRIDVGGVLMEVAADTSYSVVGISVLKASCCDYPKVYTKVSSYVDWIISNLKP